MISKELLSEVYHSEVLEIFDEHIKRNLLFFTFKDKNRVQEKVNIYELAHKCKEWALSKGYSIKILYDNDKLGNFDDILRFSLSIITRDGVTKFRVKNIPENKAIFKACECIMEQIK